MRHLTIKVILLCFIIQFAPISVHAVGSLLNLVEFTEDGSELPLASEHFRYDVDINSYIGVQIHSEYLLESCLTAESTSAILQREVAELNEFLTNSKELLAQYLQGISSTYAELKTHSTPELEAKFRENVAGQGELILQLLDILEPVVGPEEINNALRTSDPMLTDLLVLLKEHIQDLQRRLNAENLKIIKEKKITLNLWCLHKSQVTKPTAIHLKNYDNLESGQVTIIDKFSMTPEDVRHLRESLEFHKNFLKFSTEIGDREAELNQLFEELRKQFLADLDALKDGFKNKELETAFQNLKAETVNDPTNPHLTKMNQIIEELNLAHEQFNKLQLSYDELRQVLQNWNKENPVQYYATFINKFTNFKSQLTAVLDNHTVEKIAELTISLDAYLLTTADAIPVKVKEKSQELIKSTKNWRTYFANLKVTAEKNKFYKEFSEAATSLFSQITYARTLKELPLPTDAPDQIRQVLLAEAEPTVIDIPSTLRQEGDVYILYVRAYQGEHQLIGEEHTFQITRYGIYSAWNSSLIFAKNTGQSNFEPATGVSWVLHYRPRPEDGRSLHFLENVLNPGIGLNSAMFVTEQRVEYGLGVTATFFDDILQVGYGLNFFNEGGKTYFFIGASLFDFLRRN